MVRSKSSAVSPEADDKVGANLDIRARFTQLADGGLILEHRMWTTHQVQHAIRTALDRQVQEAHQLWRIAIDVNNVVGKFHRMAGGKANAVDAVNRRHQT